MECAADGNVDNFFNQMRDWCKDDGGGNPIVVVVNPTVTVTVPNRAPPTGIAPPSRPSGKKGGITVNTSRPVVTTRRATGVNSASVSASLGNADLSRSPSCPSPSEVRGSALPSASSSASLPLWSDSPPRLKALLNPSRRKLAVPALLVTCSKSPICKK
jgi:hypothetical protein